LLLNDIAQREPTVRELAAAGLFMANFYSGIENTLKRICRYHKVELPTGSDSHIELAKAFCEPPLGALPPLLDEQLAFDLSPYRQFRHVVHHGCGFRLAWADMRPGVEGAHRVFSHFKRAVEQHLRSLQAT
jgi:hypothetical protein